jgi:hypothetical protein
MIRIDYVLCSKLLVISPKNRALHPIYGAIMTLASQISGM